MAQGKAVVLELPVMGRWSEVLVEIQARIAHRFARAEVRERAGRYLFGLLGRVERKNGWQLADGVRDDLRA